MIDASLVGMGFFFASIALSIAEGESDVDDDEADEKDGDDKDVDDGEGDEVEE